MTSSPISPPLARALAERGYADLTPVQAAVLEEGADGRDLLVSAQTGSGKTVAYGLALAGTLLPGIETLPKAGEPLALVIAPTRELALQVQRELEWLYRDAGARVVSCVGGMDPRREQRALAEGSHIVVGTPGRLRDHLERARLAIAGLKAVVLDEADEMLDLGFKDDLEFILEATPAERRTLLFSATLPRGIVTLARTYQRDALRIQAAGGERGHADIEYRGVRIGPKDLEPAVVNLLRLVDAPAALIFCNTREAVRHLAATLVERGFSAVTLSGELSQSERNHAMQALRDGRARICVATDVAARGIDLPNLGLVIHADLPHDAEVLQHRSGRTGRAGRKGISVVVVPQARRRRAERLLADAGVACAWGPAPAADEIRKLDHERLLDDPLLREETGEDDAAMAQALLERHGAEAVAAALARLYRSRLPQPEDIQDTGPDEPARRPDRDRERAPSSLGETVWFRLNTGRRDRADPKWLLPLICRAGNVTRQDVGAIRIFEGETVFEIAEGAAARFGTAVAAGNTGDVVIRPMADGPAPAPAGGELPPRKRLGKTFDLEPRPPREPRGAGSKPFDAKSRADKPYGEKPYGARNRAKPYEARSSDAPSPEPKRWEPKLHEPAVEGPKPHRKGGFRKDEARSEPRAQRADAAPGSFGKDKPFGKARSAFKDKPTFKDKPAGKAPKKPYKAKEPDWGDRS